MKKKNPFHHTWKDYFTFSNRERKGLLVLFSILLIQCIALLWMKFVPSSKPPDDLSLVEKEVDAFLAGVDTVKNEPRPDFPEKILMAEKSKAAPEISAELFSFNPNGLPDADWQRLGFSVKQIRVIKHYESKGGQFRSKEDVRKMHSISDQQFARIEPYINIPPVAPKIQERRPERNLMIDIAAADSTDFEKLPGIGTYLASKICYYRDKLGGFCSVTQLREVRGISDSIYQVILPHLALKDSTNVHRMNVNEAGYGELNAHPYIDRNLAALIVNYRKQHGGFHSMEDLHHLALVNDELYCKIAPYLKIE